MAEPSFDDIDALVGPATPHFAYQLRARVRELIEDLPPEHPVRRYFDQGLMLTLNTDDPAMFATTLNREYELAQTEFSFTDEHLRELARNSFEASFLPAEKKITFLNLLDSIVIR